MASTNEDQAQSANSEGQRPFNLDNSLGITVQRQQVETARKQNLLIIKQLKKALRAAQEQEEQFRLTLESFQQNTGQIKVEIKDEETEENKDEEKAENDGKEPGEQIVRKRQKLNADRANPKKAVNNTSKSSTSMPPAVNKLSTKSTFSAQQFQRLNVEDALSYLDEVKLIFSDQSMVYNDFLDIMKEFKAGNIDTPGVIKRVSHLFKNHPRLITSFNTFLPPGYKIKVQANEMGFVYQVSVNMPSPTATHTATLSQSNCTVNVGSPSFSSTQTQPAKAQSVEHIFPELGNIHHSMLNDISSNNLNIHGLSVQPRNNSRKTLAQVSQAVSQALSQAQDGVPGTGQTQQNEPVEFNHAINYVNKIKHQFQDQPKKYKQFLDILYTYQKEQRTLKVTKNVNESDSKVKSSSSNNKLMTEAEVYSQIAKLFDSHQDLLQEFNDFLPYETRHQMEQQLERSEESTAQENKKSEGKRVRVKRKYAGFVYY